MVVGEVLLRGAAVVDGGRAAVVNGEVLLRGAVVAGDGGSVGGVMVADRLQLCPCLFLAHTSTLYCFEEL